MATSGETILTAAIMAFWAVFFALLIFNKADQGGLASWFLINDPRWRYRLVFIGILLTVLVGVFVAVLTSA